MEMNRTKRGICGICSAGCWIIATYDGDGRIVKVSPDKESSMGIICKLAEHAPKIIYSEHRLRYPMKRKGEKGNYEFERISWDDAYEIIVDKLNGIKKNSGPEAAAIYTGVGSFELSLCDVFQPKGVAVSSASSVLFPYGSPNTMGVGALCYVSSGMIAPHVTMGKMLIDMFSEVEHSELIVVWGANPATDLPPVDLKKILEAERSGAQVVVIDPRRTATAKLTGAEWIPIRPGTDGALALGMSNVLIEEELYDEDFAKNWTVGFEEFSKYVQHFRPETVAHITGVSAETVVSLARRLAGSRGAARYLYTGLEYSNGGVQAIRATLVLWALAGQLDVPGGLCCKMDKNQFPLNRDGLLESPKTDRRLGEDRFPIYVRYRDESHAIALPQAVLQGNPYKIRLLIILGGSLTTAWPNPRIWKQTLAGLDFLVCIDRQLTADAAYADIVLPSATYFEIDSYMVYGSLFRVREKMIEPVGEARSDFFILAELAKRLGYGHRYPQNPEELYNYILKGSGFTIEEVRKKGGIVSIQTEMMQYKKWEKGLMRRDGKPGFDTPSGKFEIASGILEEYGYDSLPVYTEPKEGPLSQPDLLSQYPLVFNSGSRVRTNFHTQYFGIKELVKDRPEPMVTINREDAEERGISSGDLVAIRTPRGSITMRAMVTDEIVRGVIDANHGCGSPVGPKGWQERNINDLTDLDNYDPISGFPVYKSLLADVAKVARAEGSLALGNSEITEDELDLDEPAANTEEIYFDHNATTPISAEVAAEMTRFMQEYGNPSSIHEAGRRAKAEVDQARRKIARALNCTARRIVFTGSGSEANNLALKGVFARSAAENIHVITSATEHPSILNSCQWLEKNGVEVTYLPVDRTGLIDPGVLASSIKKYTLLVSIMLANNETGTIQPIRSLAEIARKNSVLFHCDAVQGLGKIPVDVEELGVDLLSVSAHKIYGPKGVGALFIRKDVPIEEIISGGGQELGLRSGTENVMAIVGFAKAVEKINQHLSKMEEVGRLRDRLERGIMEIFENSRVNGHPQRRLANTLKITLPGFRGESLVTAMSQNGIYFSSGSACHSGSPRPSGTLLAMGLTEEQAHCSLRFSLGINNSMEQIENFLEKMKWIIDNSKSIVQFFPCR